MSIDTAEIVYGDDLIQDETEVEVVDGMLINVKTGEIVGLAGRPDFVVDSPEAAAWVLSLQMREEAQLGAIREEQEAINRNLERMAESRIHRIAWLQRRFGDHVARVAREELEREGGRSKTWRCAYGSVSFRKVTGTHRIIDMLAAVARAKLQRPEIVRVVETVTVTDVLPLLDDGEKPTWMEVTPAGEKVTVKTGVGSAV